MSKSQGATSSLPTAEFCQMDWTGERMVPGKCDALTELYHWQRYLFFRSWYDDKHVVDAGSGEGYGVHYASTFAESAIGIDVDPQAIDHARRRYPSVEFALQNVVDFDYSQVNFVTCFEVIEHLENPQALLGALSNCDGTILISTPNRAFHSPGNSVEDQPLNEFHTVEWTPTEFAEVICDQFAGREVIFFSQQNAWPGLIKQGLDPNARYCIAAILPSDGTREEMPVWPKIGVSMPTFNGAENAKEAVITLSRSYPGEMEFAVVANGCNHQNLTSLYDLKQSLPGIVHILDEPENLGFGVGSNIGLDYFSSRTNVPPPDYFAVSNDDVLPSDDCICEMVHAMQELVAQGHNPGVVGPVSNIVQGPQLVDIGETSSYAEMIFRAEQYRRDHADSASQTNQLRGLFLLIHPDCLHSVGGFDPIFNIGNCEDDDHNLRCVLAGFTLWIAQGAFLYHKGSQTFQRMGIDYEQLIRKNVSIFERKWRVERHEDAFSLSEVPADVNIFVPLTARTASEIPATSYPVKINGTVIDLVSEADTITFAGWVAHMLEGSPPQNRERLIELVLDMAA